MLLRIIHSEGSFMTGQASVCFVVLGSVLNLTLLHTTASRVQLQLGKNDSKSVLFTLWETGLIRPRDRKS